MKKTLIPTLLILVSLTMLLTSCIEKLKFEINFIVDGEVYESVKTNGEDVIAVPDNPTKEGYIFDGWYWDDGKWEKPFTANSLLDAPISSDMSVYAKWKIDEENHVHTPSEWIEDTPASCKEEGAKHKECIECGAELEAEAIEKLTTHTPGVAVEESFVDSTCEDEGSYNSVVYCKICDKKLSSSPEKVEKKEHVYDVKNTDPYYLKTEATTTSQAVYYYSCTCGMRGEDTFNDGDLLPSVLPITEEEFLKVINITSFKNFTLNATVTIQEIHYSADKNQYAIHTVETVSTTYVNPTKYSYDSEIKHMYSQPIFPSYTETESLTSGTESMCPPFGSGAGDYLEPLSIYDYLTYSNLYYDVDTGVYTVIPTQTAIKLYKSTWYVDKVEFTVKDKKIETYRFSTYKKVNAPQIGECELNYSFDFKFSNIDSTKVPGYVYSDAPSMSKAQINSHINSTSKNFTMVVTLNDKNEVDSIPAYTVMYDGKCMYMEDPSGNIKEYLCNSEPNCCPEYHNFLDDLLMLDPQKMKLVEGTRAEYMYTEKFTCGGQVRTNIRLVIDYSVGQIMSFSYDTDDGGCISYTFTDVHGTIVNCPYC